MALALRFRHLAVIILALTLSSCAPAFRVANSSSSDNNQGQGGDNSEPEMPPVPQTEDFNIFQDVGDHVGGKVDAYFSSQQELLTQRGGQGAHRVDSCDQHVSGQNRFAERISYAVLQNMTARKAKLAFISSYFALPKKAEDFYPNSLMSHQMCAVSSQTLIKTIGSQRVPKASVIKQANEFANRFNEIRSRVLANQTGATMDMAKFWSRAMMCLAYTESLTTADTSTSDRVAKKYAPSDYQRPKGVLFYEDPQQSSSSRLNIGLYQFTPDAGGNVQPCIQQWNEIYPTCAISPNANQQEMIRVTGSNFQSFNAFCGANKPTEMFSVQVNSTDVNNTHPINRKPDGSLKPAQDRCVSLHFLPGNSYNHFGPFQNSTGSNLEELLTCALAP